MPSLPRINRPRVRRSGGDAVVQPEPRLSELSANGLTWVHLDRIDKLMWPNLMILGGGVSKAPDRFIPRLTVRCPVVAASLRNDAGIIGAAIVAMERSIEVPRPAPPSLPIAAPPDPGA